MTTCAARPALIGGASACNVASASRITSGRPSSRKLAIWPIFINAPFMLPSTATTSSAVFISNAASSSACFSGDAVARRAWCDAYDAPTFAVVRATAMLRDIAVVWVTPPSLDVLRPRLYSS